MTTYQTVNPRTGEPIAEYTLLTSDATDAAVARAADAHESWSHTPLEKRAALLSRIAELHRERKAELAHTVAVEMGKPVTQAEGEIELAASIFDYYADNAAQLLADEELDVSDGGRALVRTRSIGAILGIMPWNFPVYQVARFIAPNLVLGNTILLKHARSCTQTGLNIASIVTDAGAPEGIYENLLVSSDQIADVIADPRVQGVSLTGSEEAGRTVAAQAGKHLKKCVLELGGSDPFIVLADADIQAALDLAETGRFNNAGQACTAAKRFIVHSDVYDDFLAGFVERTQKWVAGDPLDSSTKLGPMASVSGRQELAEQVDEAVASGATLHVGGTVPDGPGAYYPATILSGVTPEMRAYGEELFGPVAVVFKADSIDEAIRLANDSRFGLGSSVFTQNPELANDVADRLEAGMVGLNSLIRSKANLPFGGVKASGIGRELGRLGLDEFANKKLHRIA